MKKHLFGLLIIFCITTTLSAQKLTGVEAGVFKTFSKIDKNFDLNFKDIYAEIAFKIIKVPFVGLDWKIGATYTPKQKHTDIGFYGGLNANLSIFTASISVGAFYNDFGGQNQIDFGATASAGIRLGFAFIYIAPQLFVSKLFEPDAPLIYGIKLPLTIRF